MPITTTHIIFLRFTSSSFLQFSVSLSSMADVIRLSASSNLSILTSVSSSFNTLQSGLVPIQNLVKRICVVASNSSTSTSLPFPPRKRFASVEVRAAFAENEQPKWWEKNAGPNMIDIHSTQEFLSALSQAGDRLVVVEFYGTWCASCRALFPKLCRTAREHPEILFLKVNFDENKPMCKNLNVKVLPYFHFYRGSEGQVDGFSCSLTKFQKIKDAIALYNKAPSLSSSGPPNGVPGLHLLGSVAGELSGESAST